MFISRKINTTHDKNKAKNTLINYRVKLIVNMPEMFFDIDSDKKKENNGIVNGSMLSIKQDTFLEKEHAKMSFIIARNLWSQIQEETDVSKIDFREAKQRLVEHANAVIERNFFIMEEYTTLYKLIQYKFMGIFKVNSELLLKLSVGGFASAVSVLIRLYL